MPKTFKKLVVFSAISKLVIKASIEDISLAQVSCIHYLMQFQRDNSKTQALFDNKSEVNTINPVYAKKLNL